MDKSQVSVIIPTHNRSKLIKETIESVLSQTYKDFEVIVVDNGSTDDTKEVVCGIKDSRIHYYYQEDTGSPGGPRNRGITLAKGKYIAFLDSDDLWLPEKLEKQIPILDGNPEIGLVYSDCYQINSQGRITGKVFEDAKPCRGNIFPELFLGNFISCLTAVVRRSTLDKVGLFNPDFVIVQDYNLFLRIAQFFEIDYVNLPLAKYRMHRDSLSSNFLLGLQEELGVIEKYLERYPRVKNVLRSKVFKRLAKLHYSIGRFYQLQRNFSQSRKELSKSIRLYPFRIKAYICWFLSLLKIAIPARKKIPEGRMKK